MKTIIAGLAFVLFASAPNTQAQFSPGTDCPPVTAPPDSFFTLVRERDRDAAPGG